MAGNPIRLALHAKLAAHAPLTALVADRTYFQVAPNEAIYPLVVFHKQDGRPRWTYDDFTRWDLWTVKGVARSVTAAEEIAAAVDVALNDVSLPITGHRDLVLRWESDLPPFAEVKDGTTYRHDGAIYRLVTQPN